MTARSTSAAASGPVLDLLARRAGRQGGVVGLGSVAVNGLMCSAWGRKPA